MQRRELLRAAAAAAALSFLPREAHAIWARAERAPTAGTDANDASGVFTAQQRATIDALADAILPRTDSPGATDVGVPAFIAVIVADYYTPEERAEFENGLTAVDALAMRRSGKAFAALQGPELVAVMDALDKPADRSDPAVRGYGRMKGLVVHGYFTSRRVQEGVLKTQIMPGRWDGSAPMPASTRSGGRD